MTVRVRAKDNVTEEEKVKASRGPTGISVVAGISYYNVVT